MKPPEVSVIVCISERVAPVTELYECYRAALAASGRTFEMIYVLDGRYDEVAASLLALQERGEPLRVVQFARWFGEATAISAGCAQARGEFVLTLPAWEQIEPAGIPPLLDALADCDMVVARRWPRIDASVNRLQARLFNTVVNSLTGTTFHDLGCSARAMRKAVLDEIPLYGDQHRFLPLLAERNGFRVQEVDVAQSPADSAARLYRPGVYLRRALDVLTVFFLVKFTKKPLRFFGLVGTTLTAVGGGALLLLLIQRLFFGMPLAERPALLLASLLVVLGVQLLALGLIGELIIYTHARQLADYSIESISGGEQTEEPVSDQSARDQPERDSSDRLESSPVASAGSRQDGGEAPA